MFHVTRELKTAHDRMVRPHSLHTSLTSIRIFCRILRPCPWYNFLQNVTSSYAGCCDYHPQISSKSSGGSRPAVSGGQPLPLPLFSLTLPFLSFSPPFLFPSLSPPPPPFPQIQLGGLGQRCKLPQAANAFLVYFEARKRFWR